MPRPRVPPPGPRDSARVAPERIEGAVGHRRPAARPTRRPAPAHGIEASVVIPKKIVDLGNVQSRGHGRRVDGGNQLVGLIHPPSPDLPDLIVAKHNRGNAFKTVSPRQQTACKPESMRAEAKQSASRDPLTRPDLGDCNEPCILSMVYTQ